MRILPENPNLDHVRQQARDLLISLREADPSARLADAQRTLAAQFGFDSWRALTDDIRRIRAEHSQVDGPMLDGISEAFGLGDVTTRAFLSNDIMGSEYRVDTVAGSWYVHGVLPWVDAVQIAEAVRLMSAARVRGVPAAVPRRTPAGELFAVVENRRWRVDEWMPVGPPVTTPPTTADARRIGALLGRLHALSLRPAMSINPWLTWRRRVQHWVDRSHAARRAGAEWSDQLDAAIPALERLSAYVSAELEPSELVLSHTNLVPANVRHGAGRELVPRAWEFAGAIAPTWELGLVLHSWTATPAGTRVVAMVRPCIDAYAEVVGRRPHVEPSIFAPAINGWLQWLASRLDYALDGGGEAQSRASRELTGMLAAPLAPESFEAIVDAATG